MVSSAPIVLMVLVLAFPVASAENTTYVVALLGQDIHKDNVNPDVKYELVITNTGSSGISVDITGIGDIIATVNIGSQGREVYELDESHGCNGSEYSNKSILVHSQDGFFTLQVFTRRQDHSYVEGLLAIPVQSLAGPLQPAGQIVYNYVVATFCDIAGYCQIAVAALNDKTKISITMPTRVESIVLCKDKSDFRAEGTTTITLNRYDSLQLESTYDITGTVIYSFQPIVVFAGSRNVTNGDVVAHTIEQLVPSSHWGTEYVVQNLGTNGYGDILKIVSHWNNTKVTMTGYSAFIMADRYQTVARRLDMNCNSHIRASHPIQVIQISGLSYATENETSTLSMTVVPSVKNALTESTIVSCHGQTPVDAVFHFVKGKLQGELVINRQSTTVKTTNIKYSNYEIVTMEDTNSRFTVENTPGNSVSGIMKCETVTMPVSVLYNEKVVGTTKMTPSYDGGICYEGGKASTVFDTVSETATPYTLSLTEYPDHVLELRVRACGEAVLQFITTTGFNNSLFLTVTHKQIINTRCFPDCKSATVDVVEDNTFHSEASTIWDCEADMAFVWFRQKLDATTNKNYFCFGIGKYEETVCQGAESASYFEISDTFVEVKMMGLASDAAFTWDFVHIGGCDQFESDWRCADRWRNCSIYGTDYCHKEQFNDFARGACAKFCGKCFTDSYGRKFIVKVPYAQQRNGGESCNILVSPLNKQTNVAATITKPLPVTETTVHGNLYKNGERYYDCTSALELSGAALYTIISDDDIAVVVLFKFKGEMKSYRIYPVDTYDTEFMMLDYGTQQKECTFATEYTNVNYTSFFSVFMDTGSDSAIKSLIVNSRLQSTAGNEMSGSYIVFDKPSTVFCGDRFRSQNNANYYNQLLPLSTWSNVYVIPVFEEQAINRPFEAKLLIVSNDDNTVINITGGFDAIHASYNRGDLVTQDIDPGVAYRITATKTVGVGMYIYDPSDHTKSSFFLIPPSRNHHDTVVTSVPNKALEEMTVTDIQTFFVDDNLITSNVTKDADNDDDFYRHVHQNSALYGMTVVKSGNSHWFVIPGNMKSTIHHVNDVCNITAHAVGDNADNDCDGLSDEDVCFTNYGVYREDRDFDGGFGEDCRVTLTGPVVVSKPVEPVCVHIDKSAGQCWTSCKCKCSTLEQLEATKNMSKDELVEAQKDTVEKLQNDLHIDADSLQTSAAKKESATDDRQSAARIGYIGIGLFALVFGTVFIMDITSLLRDARILIANLRDGFERVSDFCKGRRG